MTTINRLGAVSALACAAALAACGNPQSTATQQTTAATAATSSAAPTTAADAATPAAASAAAEAPASSGPAVPAAYLGEWTSSNSPCTGARHFRFTITANTVQDNFNDLYTVTAVEPQGGGVLVRGRRNNNGANIDQRYVFATSADGATLTYTDRNDIGTAYHRCPV